MTEEETLRMLEGMGGSPVDSYQSESQKKATYTSNVPDRKSSSVSVRVSGAGSTDEAVSKAKELYNSVSSKSAPATPTTSSGQVSMTEEETLKALEGISLKKEEDKKPTGFLEGLTNTGELLSAKAGVLLGSLTQALGNSLKTDPYEKKRMIVEEIAKKNKISQQDIDTKGASAFYPYLKGDSHRIGLVNEYFAEKSGEKKQSSAVKVIAKAGAPLGEKVAPIGEAKTKKALEDIKAPISKVVESVKQSNPIVKGWTRGNEMDDLEMLIGLSAVAGDTKTADELTALRKEVEKGIPQSEGRLGQMAESISAMMPYMLKRVGAGIVTRGGVAPVVMTGFQGTGDLYGAIKELNDKAPEDQRMTSEEVVTASVIGGAAYGAAEVRQIGSVLKGVVGDKAKKTTESLLAKMFATKFAEGMGKRIATGVAETTEESIQEGIQEAMLSATKEVAGQEISDKDKVDLMKIASESAGAMASSLVTFGILKAGKNGYLYARDKITGKDAQTEEGQTPAEQTQIVTEQDATPVDLGAIEKAKEGSFGGKGSMEEYVASKTPNEIAYDAETGVITPEEHAQIMQSTTETSVSPQEAPATESAVPQEVSRDYTAEKTEIQNKLSRVESSTALSPAEKKQAKKDLTSKLKAVESEEILSAPISEAEKEELDAINGERVDLGFKPKTIEDYRREKLLSVKEVKNEAIPQTDISEPVKETLPEAEPAQSAETVGEAGGQDQTKPVEVAQAPKDTTQKAEELVPALPEVKKYKAKSGDTFYTVSVKNEPFESSVLKDYGGFIGTTGSLKNKAVFKREEDASDFVGHIDAKRFDVELGNAEDKFRGEFGRSTTPSDPNPVAFMNNIDAIKTGKLSASDATDKFVDYFKIANKVKTVTDGSNTWNEDSINMMEPSKYLSMMSDDEFKKYAETEKAKEFFSGMEFFDGRLDDISNKQEQVNAKENGRSAQERSEEKGAEGRKGERVRLRSDEKGGMEAGAGEKAEQKEVKFTPTQKKLAEEIRKAGITDQDLEMARPDIDWANKFYLYLNFLGGRIPMNGGVYDALNNLASELGFKIINPALDVKSGSNTTDFNPDIHSAHSEKEYKGIPKYKVGDVVQLGYRDSEQVRQKSKVILGRGSGSIAPWQLYNGEAKKPDYTDNAKGVEHKGRPETAKSGEKTEQKEVKHDSRTGNVTAKKVSADHVEKIVKNVKEQFPVTNVAEVHFVDGLATEGASARITITDGKPVVEIDSRLADSQVSQKVFHELIGHYGLEVMLEKSSPDIKRDIQKIIDHELDNDTPLAQMVKDLYAEDEWHHEIFANVVEEIAIKGFNKDGSKNEEFWKKNQGNIFERIYKKLKQWLHRMLGRTRMSQEERDDTVNRIIMHLGSYESPVIVDDAKYFSKMPEDIKEGFATVRMSSSAAKEKGVNFAARKKALYDLINSIIPEKEDRQELTDMLIGIKEYDEEFRGIVSVVRNMMKDKTNSIKLGLIKRELEKYKKYSKAGYIMDEDEKSTGDAIVSSFSKTVMKPVTKSDGTKSERQVTIVDTEIRNLSKKAKIERRLKNEYLDAKERADLEKELDSVKETFTSEQIDTALKFLTGVNSRMSGRRGKVIREAVAERERTREEALKEIANAIPKKVNFGIGNRSVARVGGNDVFYDIDSQQWRHDKTLDNEEVTRLGLDKLEPSKTKAFKNLEQYELINGKWHHVNAPVDFEKLTDKEVKLLNSREEKIISGATKEMLFGWTKHLPTRIRTMSWENPKTLMTKLVDNVEASLDKVIENKNITADETIGDTAIKFFKENTVATRNKVVSELEKAVNGKDRFVRVGSYTIPRDAVQYLYLAMKNKNFADTIEESGFKIDRSLNEIKIPADVINKAIEKAFVGESGKIQKYYLDKVFESYNSDNGLKGRMNKFSEETLGTKIATEPDYFPQSRANDKDQDVTISKDGEMHDLASAYAGNSAPTSRDFMKERIANKHPYIVRGVYDVIHKHNNDTALVMGMYKPYTEAINTLKDVQSELVRKGYGDIVTDAKDMLSKVTGARPGKKSEVESKFIRFMNLGNATKMAKLSVMAKQTLGALPMVPYIKNVEDKIKFLALVAANHPLVTKTIGTVAKNKIKAIDNEMVRVSPTLRDRRESMAYALAGERKGGVGEKGVSTLERISQQQLSAMLGSIDWGNIRALYVTIKDRAKKNGLSGEKLDEYMRKEMMQIVNKTQSDSNPIFRTHAQRSDSDIVRGFFMFQSQVQKQWNEVITGVHEFKAGIALKDKELAKEGAVKYIWNIIGVSFLLYFIEMLYDNAKTAMGLSEEKTDKEKVNSIKHLALETIAGKNPMTRAIVGAGLSGYLKEKFYEVKNPMLQLTNSVLKGINEDMGAIADDTKDYGDKVGFIMGNLIKGLAENSGSATQIEGVKEYIKQITDELKGK